MKHKAVRFASANAVGIRETAAIIARVINTGSYSEACWIIEETRCREKYFLYRRRMSYGMLRFQSARANTAPTEQTINECYHKRINIYIYICIYICIYVTTVIAINVIR